MTRHTSRAAGALALAAATALVLGTSSPAPAATTGVKASVRKGVLTVTGTSGPDTVSVGLRPGDATTLEVDLGADGTADLAFDRSTFTSVVVSGSGGADRLVADSTNGVFTDTEATTLDGGTDADVLVGSYGPERLVGGGGDDRLSGGVGADVVQAGDGADTVTWEPGGGSDTVDAGAGADRLQFNASNASENVALTATSSGHVRLTRDIASVELDLAAVESVDVRLLGGVDSLSAGDLRGTSLTAVTADVDGPAGDDAATDEVRVPTGVVVGRDATAAVVDGLGARVRVVGGGAGDVVHVVGTTATDEQVTVAGTAGSDGLTAQTDGADVLVHGATPGVDVRVTAADRLAVDLAGGDDTWATLGSVSALLALRVDGADGADLLSGGTGPETLAGGSGDDVVTWSPGGGSDTVDGGAGDDRVAFAGANIGETLDLSANPDGHVRLARDIAGVVLDVAEVETAGLRLLGGSDHVLVDDLSGTGLTRVDADLSGSTGTPDGSDDEVVLFGTPADDTVAVTAEGGTVVATGMPATVRVSGADPALDRLTVYALRGDDSVTATPEAAALIQLGLFS